MVYVSARTSSTKLFETGKLSPPRTAPSHSFLHPFKSLQARMGVLLKSTLLCNMWRLNRSKYVWWKGALAMGITSGLHTWDCLRHCAFKLAISYEVTHWRHPLCSRGTFAICLYFLLFTRVILFLLARETFDNGIDGRLSEIVPIHLVSLILQCLRSSEMRCYRVPANRRHLLAYMFLSS